MHLPLRPPPPAYRRQRQVDHNQPQAGKRLSLVPLDLGHPPPAAASPNSLSRRRTRSARPRASWADCPAAASAGAGPAPLTRRLQAAGWHSELPARPGSRRPLTWGRRQQPHGAAGPLALVATHNGLQHLLPLAGAVCHCVRLLGRTPVESRSSVAHRVARLERSVKIILEARRQQRAGHPGSLHSVDFA